MSNRNRAKQSGKSTSEGAKDNATGAWLKPVGRGVSDSGKVCGSGKIGQVALKVPRDKQFDDTVPGWACKICQGADTEDMVQCDVCDKWHHYECVGVADDIANVSWRCPNCVAEREYQRKLQPIPKYAGGLEKSSKQNQTGGDSVMPAVPKINAPIGLPIAVGVAGLSISSGRNPIVSKMVAALEVKQFKHSQSVTLPVHPNSDTKATILANRARSATSQSCSIKSLLKLELQKLEEERAFEQQEAERRRMLEQEEAKRRRDFELREAEKYREYIKKKYALLEEMSNRSDSSRSEAASRVDDWVNSVNILQQRGRKVTQTAGGFNPQRHSTQHQFTFPDHDDIPRSNAPAVGSIIGSACNVRNDSMVPADRTRSRSDSTIHGSEHPLTRSVQMTQQVSRLPVDEEDDTDFCQLSKKQLAARQAISKDLPVFSGKPEEWPIFISVYNSTTAMCGFSDEENIIRLQRCLKGKAYEAVQSRLLYPSNASGVIATLRMLYGQPEAIVNSLIGKINALPPLREDKLETIVDFAVNVQNFCATVDACGIADYMYNISLLHQLVSKLPPTIKLDWARYRLTLSTVNLATFGDWVYSLAEAASAITIPSVMMESKPARFEARATKRESAYLNAHAETSRQASASLHTLQSSANVKRSFDNSCPICKGSCNAVAKCKRFQELSRDSRWAAVREFDLCRRCLRKHVRDGCTAKLCGKNGCTRMHHELLHNDQKDDSPATITSPELPTEKQSGEPSHGCNIHHSNSSAVLFRYLPVVLHGKHRSIRTHAFFDEGSELTLLDQELSEELMLEGNVQPLCLRWTGGSQRNETNSRVVSLEVSGIQNSAKKFKLNSVRTVESLLLPHQTLDTEELAQLYPHIRGLPIESYSDARPRILIGMKHLGVSVVLKTKEGGYDEPIAVKTRLGWTVCGGWKLHETLAAGQCAFHVCVDAEHSDENLHQAVKAYFAMDSLGITKSDKVILSSEDQRAENILKSRTQLVGNRYETGLLWRYEDIRLPDSREMALRRHQSLITRMDKDPFLAEALQQMISDYVAKGYARKLSDDELKQTFPRVWYLPVFPVTNPNKPGKVRLVWDAAAKSFGISLNSVLLKGPDYLCSLFAILLQFREGRIGLAGDVREMFHQIRIRDEDQQCQRFFWTDKDGNLATYVMSVMTFGACCSPSSAQYAMTLNAERFSHEFPTAAKVIIKRHYVDDMLVSTNSEQDAIRIAEDVHYVHSRGGFEIRNWISNSKRVLGCLKQDKTHEKNLDLSPELSTEKVLGMSTMPHET
ncbi:uncharacterized protein LOC131680575 [Topomyia yanbarensis]|uniref:uncharacterized protein LOC131680575 n=1 Tax=Topomyia yanbarensis TaxID=2498891 RepID=UPI00273B6FA8|nr:uncharacterized protein LOC131680575 [Topomyia yanbarensis]